MGTTSKRKDDLCGILGDRKPREEVMKEIEENPAVYSTFLNLNKDFREQFVQFCMGVRGVKVTYDPFFKYIFNAEEHPERLSDMLSLIIGEPLIVKRMLPNEHTRITGKGALLVMDMLVEFENGELADVEIQKSGYLFPGQRASCYASDMIMRQYEREKSREGAKFTYKDLKKVYTIVLIENSTREFWKFPGKYIHRGKCVFDSGIKLEMLQEFFFIPLDIFRSMSDNESNETKMNELTAWLLFISSDRAEDIRHVIESHPKFVKMYQEIVNFRYCPEEAVQMFSDALRILDENTTQYMIDELKQERDLLVGERDKAVGERNLLAGERDRILEREQKALKEVERLKKLLAESQ